VLSRIPALTGEEEIRLPVPLREFPLRMHGWEGEDVAIPTETLKVAGNDDYLSRLFRRGGNGEWATVYVAYTARPRTMLGHQPEKCYPATGWVHDGTEKISITAEGGQVIPCLLHRFHKPEPYRHDMVVLNYYVVNGEFTNDSSVFSGVDWKTPNIKGDIARYVAQVQISSVLEGSVRAAARDLAEEILKFLPDKMGVVRATVGVRGGTAGE
jgi:EpsI family protein